MTPTPPASGSRAPRRLTGGPDTLAALAGRLTVRDRWLLAMLHEHRVLTTAHIGALAFAGPRRATLRLTVLYQARAIDRFRPHIPYGAGSAPYHWILHDTGAAALAAHHGITVADLGYRRDHALTIAHSQRLTHTTGTATVLTALAATGRLAAWWGERRCAAAWGDLARPDAYAEWHTPDRRCGFAVEYDTGSETLARVTAKLDDYAELADVLGHPIPVLFWLPTTTRETALHRQLRGHLHTANATVLAATAAADHAGTTGGPAGPVWLPAAANPARGRHTLDQLTQLWPPATPAADRTLNWPAPPPLPPGHPTTPAQPATHPDRPTRTGTPTNADRTQVGTRRR